MKLPPLFILAKCAESFFFFYGAGMIVSVFWEETAGAARCLMSSAASERSLAVKAPSITAPPCGLSLHQQPGNLSLAEEAPWVRITLSRSYFTRCILTLLLISLFHTRRPPPTLFPSVPHFRFSRSPTAFPSQADWLPSSRLLHHTGHFQFFSFSFKGGPPPHTHKHKHTRTLLSSPTLPNLPHPMPVSLGGRGGGV